MIHTRAASVMVIQVTSTRGAKVLCSNPILSVQVAHVRSVHSSNITKYAERAWQAQAIEHLLSHRFLLLVGMLLELFISSRLFHLDLPRSPSVGLLIHELHLHSLLVMELLHVLAEVLRAHNALGVVAGDHCVTLVH